MKNREACLLVYIKTPPFSTNWWHNPVLKVCAGAGLCSKFSPTSLAEGRPYWFISPNAVALSSSSPKQTYCAYLSCATLWVWYVSNVSIIFDCSMLLYYLFRMFMGFILHIYIIFGTNLLTGGPARIAVFFSYFSISKKRNIKRSPNGMKPSGAWFLERTWSRGLGVQVKKQSEPPRDRRARPLYRARPLSHGPLGRPPTYIFLLYKPTYPENIEEPPEEIFSPP